MHSTHSLLNFSLNIRGALYAVTQPQIMGILNITPDSFYDGGEAMDIKKAIDKTRLMVSQGANIIDVGAMSSRPYRIEISIDEEMKRIQEIFPDLINEFPEVIFSVDTYRSEVADFCLRAGASMVNDITAGRKDERILDVVSHYHCPYIAMHMLGEPEIMQNNPVYSDVMLTMDQFFAERMEKFVSKGLCDIILDVGFGFGKSIEDNYRLLKNLSIFSNFQRPILVGISRKSMILKPLQIKPSEGLNGTTALHWEALKNGAAFLRVHDVKEAKQVCDLFQIYRDQ